MRHFRSAVVFSLLAAACSRDLEVPPAPPAPGPGTIFGRVVYAAPGQSALVAAPGAQVRLLGSSLAATAGDDGQFLLENINQTQGELLFRIDTRHDGNFDRQRTIRLESVGAGPGRQVGLGDVSVGQNAQLHGRVLLQDRAGMPGGQGGTTVFVPQGPFTAYTNDDGTWALANLPQGPIRVSIFHPAYTSVALDVIELGSGQDYAVADISLQPAPGMSLPGTVGGSVSFIPALASADGTSISLAPGGPTGDTAADGTFKLTGVPPGLYSVTAAHAGYTPATVFNVLVEGGFENSLPNIVLTTAPELDGGFVVPDGGPIGPGDGGSDGGVDAGPSLPCGGCAAGLTCAAGSCVSQSCATLACALGEACLDGGCVQGTCVGVSCGAGEACGNGKCYPVGCGATGCDGGLCWQGACVSADCAGLNCGAGETCVGGTCAKTCGAGCAAGQVCSRGGCVPGCFVAGAGYPAGTFQDTASCHICDPSRDPGGFSPVLSGAECVDGLCVGGLCTTGCAIGGKGWNEGDVDPGNPCRVCSPFLSTTAFTPGNEDQACPGGGFCRGGVCTPGCVVAQVFVADQSVDPVNPCQSCQPARASRQYSALADATACSLGGNFCRTGQCVAACAADGGLFAPGEVNPWRACSSCQPGTNPTGFSPVSGLPASTVTCPGGGQVCQGGACTPGCFLDGLYRAAGVSNPDGGVSCCAPAFSIAGWSARWQVQSLGAGTGLNSMVLADLGNPRGLDVVTGSATDGTVSVLTNLGNGAFAPAQSFVVVPPNQPYWELAVAGADLTGDGVGDLLLQPAGASNGITGQPLRVVPGLDGGAYGAPLTVPLQQHMLIGASSHFFPGAKAGAVFLWNQTLSAIDTVGVGVDGGLQVVASKAVGFGWNNPASSAQAVVADFNHDGLDDLAMVDAYLKVLLNDGTGHFGGVADYLADAPYAGLAVAPFTGRRYPDGKPILDLVATFTNGVFRLEVMRNDGAGSFSLIPATLTVSGGGPTLAAGDFNGDGKSDVVAGNGGVSTQVFYGTGAGGFTVGTPLQPGVLSRGFGIAAGPVGVGGVDAVVGITGSSTVSFFQPACR